jgi:3-deoxy-D-manno-octulosonate 8-phosphate phosphatase (KDO 8-P phosphatase)
MDTVFDGSLGLASKSPLSVDARPRRLTDGWRNSADCAFVGDDIPDLPLLKKVGYSVAVANAVQAVIEHCHYTTHAAGGRGAVREVCDLILAAARKSDG